MRKLPKIYDFLIGSILNKQLVHYLPVNRCPSTYAIYPERNASQKKNANEKLHLPLQQRCLLSVISNVK